MKNKPRVKKHGLNPAKQKLLAKQQVGSFLEKQRRERCRMLWCMIISMHENSDIEFTQDDIIKIINGVQDNFDEYNSLAQKYGEDLADEKLSMRVNEILTANPFSNEPDVLYDNSEDDNGKK